MLQVRRPASNALTMLSRIEAMVKGDTFRSSHFVTKPRLFLFSLSFQLLQAL